MARFKKIVYTAIGFMVIFLVPVLFISMRDKFTLKEAQEFVAQVDCGSLKNEAISVMSIGEPASLPDGQWPPTIKKLKPRSVSIDQDGMWITKSSFFVEEEGLFIPKNDSQEYQERRDPYFESLCPQVYYFWLTG